VPPSEDGGRVEARPAENPEAIVLARVNGESITSRDLDALLIRSHTTMGDRERATFDFRKLLDRLVHDRLLIQQARALGLDQDEELLAQLWDRRVGYATREYVRTTFEAPDSVAESEIRVEFEEFYWKIQLRQISVPTKEAAQDLVGRIRKGASMDSLAKEVSVDSRRYRGGLHNLVHWVDVDPVLRGPSRDLASGDLSEPFPYRNVYAFVRVEERLPPDDAEYQDRRRGIEKALLSKEKKAAWRRFLQGLGRRIPVRVDSLTLAEIAADSALAFTGEFLVDSDRPVLTVDGGHTVTSFELRKELSHNAMQSARTPFDTLLAEAIEKKREDLLLLRAAEEDGWLDNEAVVAEYEKDLERTLIDAYLTETIVPQIEFRRSEFQEYYDSHLDDFRGPPQVLLGTVLLGSKAEADEVASRLREGADIGFLRKQYSAHGTEAIEDSKWVSASIFSGEIRDALSRLEVGQSTDAFEVATGWMVFKLKDRRAGPLKSLEEADMQIREIMYRKIFKRLLDEHLELLRDRSDLELYGERIDEYFGSNP
jgi:parvulin-like peptidyl-prolyl isomerase